MIAKINCLNNLVKNPNIYLFVPKYLGPSINRIFNEPVNKKNPLQPSIKQVEKLENMTKINSFLQNLTPIEWCKVLAPYKSYLFSGKSYLKIPDQEFRAKMLLEYITKNPSINTIVTMDGHGRFILTLLQKLGYLSNTIKIIVPEINPIVNRWHINFFPSAITSVNANIYDFEPDEHTLIYMNFCGIGGINGQKELANYLSNIKSKTYTDLHMMISISTARAGKGSCEWLETYDKEWLNSYKKSYEATKVSNGPMNNFPTYCLKWPKIQ